jgi:hypothetical protein
LKKEEIGHGKGRIETIKFFMEKQKTFLKKGNLQLVDNNNK